MENFYLQCNFQKCRKTLKETAWVTTCSHIFCDEDGSREFSKASVCPACKTILPEENGFIKQNLNPSSSLKSLMLAGLSPEIVMEIGRKGILFWAYQTQHHLLYKQEMIDSVKEKYNRMAPVCEQAILSAQNYAEVLKIENQRLKQENANYISDMKKMKEKETEKEFQMHNKNKAMYDNLRGDYNSPNQGGNRNHTPKRDPSQSHEMPSLTTRYEKCENSGEDTNKNDQIDFQSINSTAIYRSQVPTDEKIILFNF